MTQAQSGSFVPVSGTERVSIVDILRGFALLGILAINIDFFALPSSIMFAPSLAGGFTGLDLLTWKVDSMLFFEKMMAIFSMLFGGGLILMMERAEKAGRKLGGIYYRRLFWLLLFGLIHAYFFWYGDILVSYAICGLVIFLFRKRGVKTLIILGIVVLLLGAGIQAGGGFGMGQLRKYAAIFEEKQEAGETLTTGETEMLGQWNEMKSFMRPDEETIAKDIAAYQGSLAQVHEKRVEESLMMHLQALPFMMFWRILGLMLLGMALMKSGFFKGEKSNKTYIAWIIAGYGIGLPVVYLGMETIAASGFDFIARMKVGGHYNYFGSILVALAHASTIILLYKSRILMGFLKRLEAVGRMALSNYFLDTLICTTIFFGGLGFGLFGTMNRFSLAGIVVVIWILQLIVSPIWLKHFRFGPFEWCWRSLTYWNRQPMKR
ncbi:MAG: DUF418 domain-containing protein [candidate division Zixibacteria bacterium]|nr:DUF418 domain-containing protein [candidate division Zixibacteria bacterium]